MIPDETGFLLGLMEMRTKNQCPLTGINNSVSWSHGVLWSKSTQPAGLPHHLTLTCCWVLRLVRMRQHDFFHTDSNSLFQLLIFFLGFLFPLIVPLIVRNLLENQSGSEYNSDDLLHCKVDVCCQLARTTVTVYLNKVWLYEDINLYLVCIELPSYYRPDV